MSEEEFLRQWIDFCNKKGYGSPFSQVLLIPDFLHTIHVTHHKTHWDIRTGAEVLANGITDELSIKDMFFAGI